jgi:uncharacterized phage protein (TIGR02220 family)
MAKRFIDTRMFEDEWVCSLTKDAKLFFIYYITTCDHAGILKLNRSLCEFQTKLKSFDTIIKELGDSLVTVKDNVFFMPKFIKFQYPNFPQSNVKQQEGALKILFSYGISEDNLKSYLTVSKEFNNSYVNVSDNVIVNEVKESNEFDFVIFLDWFNKTTNRNFKSIPEATKKSLLARIKEGYTKDDIVKAVINCSKDKFHIENPKYLTPEFISRADKLALYLSAPTETKTKQVIY